MLLKNRPFRKESEGTRNFKIILISSVTHKSLRTSEVLRSIYKNESNFLSWVCFIITSQLLHCWCGEIVKKAKPREGDLITSPQILHFKNTKTTFEIPHVSGYLKKYQNIKSPPFSTLNWLERGTETTAPGKHSEWDQRDDSTDGDAASGIDDASLAHTHTHTHISLKRNELKKKTKQNN